MKLNDLSGQRFGLWTVVRKAEGADAWPAGVRWLCICDCGVSKFVRANALRGGKSRSCGCQLSELTRVRRTTHGLSRSAEYSSWRNMWVRCTDPRNPGYKNYGARGVSVCPSWATFDQFFKDMGPKPPGGTIERKNNELGYSKSNCVWAGRSEQNNNTRRSVHITAMGRTQSITQWAAELGVSRGIIYRRIRGTDDHDQALRALLKSPSKGETPCS